MKKTTAALALLLLAPQEQAARALAGDAAPAAGGDPVFMPGMYETESRNSRFQNAPVKARVCIHSADFETFVADTMKQYRSSPQFARACKLGETRRTEDGFAFAMDCRGSKSIVTFHFSRDLVAQTVDNLIEKRRSASSSILTMMRRIGDCEGQKVPGKDI